MDKPLGNQAEGRMPAKIFWDKIDGYIDKFLYKRAKLGMVPGPISHPKSPIIRASHLKLGWSFQCPV